MVLGSKVVEWGDFGIKSGFSSCALPGHPPLRGIPTPPSCPDDTVVAVIGRPSALNERAGERKLALHPGGHLLPWAQETASHIGLGSLVANLSFRNLTFLKARGRQ